MNDLEKYRKEVDRVDQEIIEAIAERTNWVYKIASYKSRNDMLIADEEREKEIFDKIKNMAIENNMSETFVYDLYKLIIEYCRGIQKLRK